MSRTSWQPQLSKEANNISILTNSIEYNCCNNLAVENQNMKITTLMINLMKLLPIPKTFSVRKYNTIYRKLNINSLKSKLKGLRSPTLRFLHQKNIVLLVWIKCYPGNIFSKTMKHIAFNLIFVILNPINCLETTLWSLIKL